jgi:threonine/homoserine/homoserine lactone efflux protein
LALTLGNLKVIVFLMAILPRIVTLERLTLSGITAISLVIGLVMIAVSISYSIAAERARQLLSTASALKMINRVTGGVVAAVAVARA